MGLHLGASGDYEQSALSDDVLSIKRIFPGFVFRRVNKDWQRVRRTQPGGWWEPSGFAADSASGHEVEHLVFWLVDCSPVVVIADSASGHEVAHLVFSLESGVEFFSHEWPGIESWPVAET